MAVHAFHCSLSYLSCGCPHTLFLTPQLHPVSRCFTSSSLLYTFFCLLMYLIYEGSWQLQSCSNGLLAFFGFLRTLLQWWIKNVCHVSLSMHIDAPVHVSKYKCMCQNVRLFATVLKWILFNRKPIAKLPAMCLHGCTCTIAHVFTCKCK